jgi:hypothetical protein
VGEAGAPDAEWIRKRIGELTGQEISRPPQIVDDDRVHGHRPR